MVSLIVILIAVVLVAVLALATQYYGSSAMTQGVETANAATVLNQGLQLRSAAQLYFNDKGYWPSELNELVTGHYLNAIPVSVGQTDGEWSLPKPGVPTFTLAGSVTSGVCRQINQKSFGNDGVPAKAYPDVVAQCYGGGDPRLLTVVISAQPERVSDALPIADVGTGPRPLIAGDSGWTEPPLATGSGTVGTVTYGPFICDALSIESGQAITCSSTVTNNGGSSATLGGLPVSNDAEFLPSTACPALLPAGATCAVSVTGKPITPGARIISISWPTPALKQSSQTFSVTITPAVETVFVLDDFTGASSLVTGHTGQVGASWLAYAGNPSNYSVNYAVDGQGNMYGPGFSRAGFILSSGQPGAADEYFIELTVSGDPPYDAWNYFGYLTVGVLSPGISISDGYTINLYNSSQGRQQIFMSGATTAAGKSTWGTAWYNMGWTPEFSAIEFGVPHILRFEFYRDKKRILLDGQLLSEFADREAGPAGPLYLQYTRGIIVNKVKMAKL